MFFNATINCNKAFDTKLKMPPNTCLIFADQPKNMTADVHQIGAEKPGSFYHSILRHLSSITLDTDAAKHQNK